MSVFINIQGEVTGSNSLLFDGRIIECWTNSIQSAEMPKPLDLKAYIGKIVEVSGCLHGDLWNARFIKVVYEEGYQRITGKVIGSNIIQGPDGPVNCFRHGMVQSWFMRLDLNEYMGMKITVSGELHGNDLYRAQVVQIVKPAINKPPEKEAKSLNDLLRIRAANRSKIEAVNGNLGTALGFKWTNGIRTNHPCIIVFVPQKISPSLIPNSEKIPEIFETDDGKWCLTDVVTGGKAGSLEEIGPLPPLSDQNQRIVKELKSGRIGLIGGIQLAFYGNGIEDSKHSYVGTAGIAVRSLSSGKIGFLTNQHVAETSGRIMFHPWHKYYPIGQTYTTLEYSDDESWYNGVIDENDSYIRCDCGFIQIYDYISEYVKPGVHTMEQTGDVFITDLNNMNIIGQKVISVGRTRGIQRGKIVAYAYEYHDEYNSIYTDFLILGEEGNAFSWKGDSGKVILTDDDAHQPIALLWGGWQERLRKGHEQEIWSYAIDLYKVLDRLNLEVLR